MVATRGTASFAVLLLAVFALASAESPLSVEVDWSTTHQGHRTWFYRAIPHGNPLAKPKLVLRRGQDFDFSLTISDGLPLQDLRVVAEVDIRTKSKLSGQEEFRRFGEYELGQDNDDFTLLMQPSDGDDDFSGDDAADYLRGGPVTAGLRLRLGGDLPIGLYEVTIRGELSSPDNSSSKSFVAPFERPLAVLGNPWSKSDRQLYWGLSLENESNKWADLMEADLDEYVMNEKGAVWTGDASSYVPWRFGQFDPEALPVAFHLIEKCASPESRRDVVVILRCLSEYSPEVLMGRWMEPYKPQTEPWVWTGSDEIIKQYFNSRKVVMYGQCWVYAGLLVSLSRTLGVPTRAVTTMSSAHDADTPYNRAIDHFYDREGRVIRGMSFDSIWNFHVWCEAWVRRDDLGTTYGGWNAFDATPQEASPRGSMHYRMGPTSVRAVYEHTPRLSAGVDQNSERFDNSFVIGEVDAMEAHWVMRPLEECMPKPSNSSTASQAVTLPKAGKQMLTYKLECFHLQRVEYGIAGVHIYTYDYRGSASIFNPKAEDVGNSYHEDRSRKDFLREEHPHVKLQKSLARGEGIVPNTAEAAVPIPNMNESGEMAMGETTVYDSGECSMRVGALKDTGRFAFTDGLNERIYMGEDITALVLVHCKSPRRVQASIYAELAGRDMMESGTPLRKAEEISLDVSRKSGGLYRGSLELELPALLYTREIRNNERTVLIRASVEDSNRDYPLVDGTEVHINDRPLNVEVEETAEGRSVVVTFLNPAPITVHNVYATVSCECFPMARHLLFSSVDPRETVKIRLPIGDDMGSLNYFEDHVKVSKSYSFVVPKGSPEISHFDEDGFVGGQYDVMSSFATIDGLIWSAGGTTFDISLEEAFGFWNTAVLCLMGFLAIFLASTLCVLALTKFAKARSQRRVFTGPVTYLQVTH